MGDTTGQATNPFNPAGFDLYVTEDGVNVQVITRNGGFGGGDRYNYGARTLVSGSDGNLYLGTANPFYGCQVWKLAVVDDDDTGGGGGGGGCTAIPTGKFFLLFLLPLAFLTGLVRIGRWNIKKKGPVPGEGNGPFLLAYFPPFPLPPPEPPAPPLPPDPPPWPPEPWPAPVPLPGPPVPPGPPLTPCPGPLPSRARTISWTAARFCAMTRTRRLRPTPPSSGASCRTLSRVCCMT